MCKRVFAFLSMLSLVALLGCGEASKTETTTTTTSTKTSGDAPKKPKAGTASKAVKFPDDKGNATIKGVVSLDGEAPKMPKLNSQMEGTAACAAMHKDPILKEEVVSKDGKLANAVVYVKSVDGEPIEDTWTFDPPSTEVTIDQKGCMYSPHVLAVQVDQPVAITSSDSLAHNIHYVPGNNKEFNESQQTAGSKKVVKFSEPDLGAMFSCQIHSWMKAYLFVFPHKFFAVTKEDGSYELKGLPGGHKYEIALWQESDKLGAPAPDTVDVKDNDNLTKDYKFKVK